MNKKRIFGLAACLYTLWFISCTNKGVGTDAGVAGNGTRTGNPTIAGVLFKADGHTPARSAQVRLRKKSFLNNAAVMGLPKRTTDTASATTGSDGRFSIDSVDTGTYVIEFIDSNNNRALNDSVVIQHSDSILTLPPDTLKPAGAIKGIIKLSNGGDCTHIYILAFGIDRFANAHADGSFIFGNLAEGKYDLRMITTLTDYYALDTTKVPVLPGDTTNLDTIGWNYLNIPPALNLLAQYDTLKHVVKLSWKKIDSALVNGYHIYGRNAGMGEIFMRQDTGVYHDTVYFDSNCLQGYTYEFCISAVNKKNIEGMKSSALSVFIASFFSIDTAFTQCFRQREDKFLFQNTFTSGGNGLVYSIAETNRKVQAFDTNFTFIRQLDDTALHCPGSVASSVDGRVFISDVDSATNLIKSIFIFNRAGSLEKILPVSVTMDSLHNAIGVGIKAVLFAVDGGDRISFVNQLQDSIYVCDTTGVILRKWAGSENAREPIGSPGFGIISYIAIDQNDDVFVDNFETKVSVFDSLGTLQRTIATSFVTGIAVEPQTNRAFVTHTGPYFEVFSAGGELVTSTTYPQNVYQNGGPTSEILLLGRSVYVSIPSACMILKMRNNLP